MKFLPTDNAITLVAENSMDVAYLKHIFDEPVKLITDYESKYKGFNKKISQDISITIEKSKT